MGTDVVRNRFEGTKELDGGDTLDVTSTGLIVGGEQYNTVYVTGDQNNIILTGKIETEKSGISLSSGSNNTITVNGLQNGFAQDGALKSNYSSITSSASISIYNYGNIISTGSQWAAISFHSACLIENKGLIEGGVAGIWFTSGGEAPSLNLTNSGHIRASGGTGVFGSYQSDFVVNTGTIEGIDGAVSLGSGADTYDGRNGIALGSINLGHDNDIAYGGSGVETILGGFGEDDISAGGGGDSLSGGADNDVLRGDGGADTLEGGEHNDVLEGGAGADRLDGGSEIDTAWYNSSSTVGVKINLAEGTASGGEAEGDTLFNIENVTGSLGDDELRGDSKVNVLKGGDGGKDTLSGGGGSDILYGQNGSDILDGEAGEDHLEGGDGDDILRGGSDKDVLNGGSDNDTLEGGAGADVLDGGDGARDFAWYNSSSTIGVNIDLADGAVSGGEAAGDRLIGIECIIGSRGGDVLRGDDNVNVLNGGGGSGATDGGDDVLSGRGGSDALNGEGGNDTLEGGADADTLVGGAGMDFAWYNSDSPASVLVNLAEGFGYTGEALGDSLSGIEGIVGSKGNDGLIGDDNVNILNGGGTSGGTDGGDDTLKGAGGNDALNGEGGDDRLDGGAHNDTLIGGKGNDVLDGGAGADELNGGAGDDTYIIDANDVPSAEAAGGGHDTVETRHSMTLQDNFEDLTGIGAVGLTLTGNGVANTVVGTSGGDVIDGGAGAIS
ncbi:calcium-binding protein [Microvirga aerophila]|uniref:Calcium-binding protein n=1 Tax=Microvirga aerophila TaxID=670291 RepID=A0A512BME5_9HYPH|nr:calcium-binding protein [Microvirga aerophila]GEO13121.1 hypothetical protein MAE02_08170 [Microvirga aerophila]